ncbi:MAG: DUF4292 domain-containing protein [Bacteroidales bacterium]|nr:DUF4292 domain-containing protein [Bacteroidales bacterium]
MRRLSFLSIKSILLCCVFLITACKSTKELSEKSSFSGNAKLRFESYLKDQVKFESLQSKLNIEFSIGGKTMSSRATLKIKKNEFIQLSVQPVLGIEMFRLVITPESFLLIDKMNRRYFSESIEVLEELVQMEMDFNLFQSLFTNQMFLPYQRGQGLNFHAFENNALDDEIEYIPKKKNSYDCRFLLDVAAHLIQTTICDASGRNQLQWSYQNFVPMGNKPYPIRMNVTLDSQLGKIGMVMNSSDTQFGKSVKADLSVSNRYQKVSLSQIKSMF